MGHVSNFNGMNTTCDEPDLTQATPDLISADSLLDLPLNENFMPIYHSFPDDIYRQPHLYASNNLTSFMNNDDDRSGYFDEPLELDLFLDSNFNIDFGPAELENSQVVQNQTDEAKIEEKHSEKNNSTIHIENIPECTSNQVTPHDDSEIQNQITHVNGNFCSTSSKEDKSYSASAEFSDSESVEEKNEQIPKIIIKLKPEPQDFGQDFSCTDNSSIGNNAKPSSTNNESVNLEPVKIKVKDKHKDKHKHKKHKKKSRHKKKHGSDIAKNKTCEMNENFNDSMANCTTESCIDKGFFLNRNADVNVHTDSDIHAYNQHTDDNSNEHLSYAGKNSETHENDYMLHEVKTEPLDDDIEENVAEPSAISDPVSIETRPAWNEMSENGSNESLIISDSVVIKTEPVWDEISQGGSNASLNIPDSVVIKTEPIWDEISQGGSNASLNIPDSVAIEPEPLCDEMSQSGSNEPLAIDDAVDFQFEFENADELSLSPSLSIKQEKDTSMDDFVDEIDTSFDENIPYKSVLKTVRQEQTAKYSEHNGHELHSENETENESAVLNNEPSKSNSASDLIEELNAHHQQVFEEIEVSTTELQIELNDEKNSDIRPKTSHQTQISANDHTISQNKIISKHSENDMNSQNHISINKTVSPNHHISEFQASNHHSSTSRLRNISSSSSSVNSKSSTSHRSYRKRRRSSSSSSSSDQEKFYNRPVKFDPVTQTYCDEFGREIRQSELKYYLNIKSSYRDSHSNNGSSSNSRSKSPRYKNHHRKYHKSRSGSRSHRRRHHSSSRSRSGSRSRSRRHKESFNRKYRSPSPKHRVKRHYLDVEENMRAYEERRVMYVGDIPPDYTVDQLKERFSRFGPIQSASIKSKFTADGSLYIFGFVTFKNRSDVCQAIERGNENPSWPRFDLNFGGRRRFCNGNYTDLDGKVAEAESGWYQTSYRPQPRQEDDFAELLRQEQRRLGMSKK